MTLFDTLVPMTRRSPALPREEAGRRTIRPLYEVKESEDGFGLQVYLPGVAKEALELTCDAGEIRIVGRRTWKKPEGWTPLYTESAPSDFELKLRHDNIVDPEKIHAELKDGVLRVSLPKAENIKPRRIEIS